MAIPISRYIEISAAVNQGVGSSRSFAGLVFTDESMADTAPSDTKTTYDANGVVSLSLDAVKSCFASTTNVYKFAVNYFGYTSVDGKMPGVLNIVKMTTGSSDTPLSNYTNVLKSFTNFGSFAFVTTTAPTASQLDAVAEANDSNGLNYLFCIGVPNASTASYNTAIGTGRKMTFLQVGDTLSSWIPMAWVAARDYDTSSTASSTIAYKSFSVGSSDYVVDDSTTADTLDGYNFNYIAHVQERGVERTFCQTGVTRTGIDAGTVIDSAWIQAQIEAGWIDMASNSMKIPANSDGAVRVKAMIVSVAEDAISNGCILVDKPLTSAQETEIDSYTGVSGSYNSVQSVGYYISTKIVLSGTKYKVKYTLVYAKGDHIQKVDGSHILI